MKILFTTDFSNASENAFIYALRLADHLKATVTVLHIYEILEAHSWIEDATDMNELNEKITTGEFERFKNEIDVLKRVARENAEEHVEINYSLKESDETGKAILEEATQMNADLLVMGTKGVTGIREILFGSTTSYVMPLTTRPMVIVPETSHYRGIENVALPLLYKNAELSLIEMALTLTKRMGAKLNCVHVDVYDPKSMKEKAHEYESAFLQDPDIKFHTQFDLDVEKGLHDFLKFNQIDAVITQAHKVSVLKELFSGNLSKRLAYHADIPLIVLPEKIG